MFSMVVNFLDHSYTQTVAFVFLIGVFYIILGSASTALFLAASIAAIFLNLKIAPKALWQETLNFLKATPILLIFPAFFLTIVITSLKGENWLNENTFVAGSYWHF